MRTAIAVTALGLAAGAAGLSWTGLLGGTPTLSDLPISAASTHFVSLKGADASAAALALDANDMMDRAHGRGEILQAAGAKLRSALAVDENEPVALVVFVRWYLMTGQNSAMDYRRDATAKAEQLLDRALTLDPKLGRAYTLHAHVLTSKGDLEGARAALATAEAFGYVSPWIHINRAGIHLAADDWEAAAVEHRRVIDGFVDNEFAVATSSGFLRRYHARRFERASAEMYYRRQIELDPTSAWARGNWAEELLLCFADYDAAIATAREALDVMNYGHAQRTLALALYGKWALLLSRHKPDEAKPFFDEARKIWPDLSAVAREAEGWVALEFLHIAITQPDSYIFKKYEPPARR